MLEKHFLLSKTIWLNALGVVSAVALGLGVDLGLDGESTEAIALGAYAAANVVLRIVTDRGIHL